LDMTELRQLSKQDLERAAEICAGAIPPEFHVSRQKLLTNLFSDPDFSPEASFAAVNPAGKVLAFAGVKISSNQELYPDTAWISIMAVDREVQGQGLGTRLMEKVLSVLQTKAIKQIFLGMDFNNFFSGIPAPDERKAAFFEKFGFVVSAGEHYDLEADIIHNAFIDSFDDSAFAAEYPVHLFHGEREKVLDFLHREFPGRWEYEFSEALQEKKDFDEIVVLWNRDETEVAGYAMLHAERDAEGKKTGYGGLGPIGIAEKIRGHHVGDYILHEGLLQLRKIGVETVNIDWTILKDFYGQFGFEPARIYRAGVIQKA